MRLRRETGDFSIVYDSETTSYKPIPAGLSAEDLIGAIAVLDNGVLAIVDRASVTGGGINIWFSTNRQVLYNPVTGEITAGGVG